MRAFITGVSRRGEDTTVRLARGSIIVQVAPQGKGHLYVRTDDCLVAVTGTLFSVTSGTKGSRVSVIEGEVRCQEGAKESVLTPGEQLTTQEGLAQVPVEEEIAWSRHLDRHLALLREIAEIRKEIEQKIPLPAPRTSTRLLDLTPPGPSSTPRSRT